MEDRLEEILKRLEALERRVEKLSAMPAHEDAGCPLRTDERRIVDTIVRLVAERMERSGDRDRGYCPPPPPEPPHHHHGPPRRR